MANEIRNLAEESKETAQIISRLIKDIQTETNQTIEDMETGFSSVIDQIQMVENGGKSISDILLKVEKT